jgi:hypothetical protein
MPRIRSIKPQFWLDENLGGIPRDARLLYIGLWNLADDQGVFEWRPARIKVQLFPYDADVTSKEIEGWLELLLGTEDIAKFEFDGRIFGYIRSFLEHQDIKKPSKWTFAPVPQELGSSTPPVGEELPTTTPPVPLGSRLKGKGVGNREKKEAASPEFQETDFNEFTEELRAEFKDIDFDNEFKKFKLYWSEGGRKLKRPKLALRNWMEKARQILAENDARRASAQGHERQSSPPAEFLVITDFEPDPKAEKVWAKALGELEKKVSGPNFRTWLAPTRVVSFKEDVFVVGVPSASVAKYLEENQRSLIERVIVGLTRTGVKVVFGVLKGEPG